MSLQSLPQQYPAAQDTAGQSPAQTSEYPSQAAALREAIRRLTRAADDARLVALADDDRAAVIAVCRLSRLIAEWRCELAALEASEAAR